MKGPRRPLPVTVFRRSSMPKSAVDKRTPLSAGAAVSEQDFKRVGGFPGASILVLCALGGSCYKETQ